MDTSNLHTTNEDESLVAPATPCAVSESAIETQVCINMLNLSFLLFCCHIWVASMLIAAAGAVAAAEGHI